MVDVCCIFVYFYTGYNNSRVKEEVAQRGVLDMLVSRPALGVNPPGDYVQWIQSSLLKVCKEKRERGVLEQ